MTARAWIRHLLDPKPRTIRLAPARCRPRARSTRGTKDKSGR
jgi:hypothetical protein